MRNRTSLVWIASALLAVSTSFAAAGTEKINNEQVVVTDETLAPGETASLSGSLPSMLVFLDSGTAQFVPAHGQALRKSVQRGNLVFRLAQTEKIKNDSSSQLSFVRIEFKNKGDAKTWGMAGLSPNYKMLLENRYMRAYDIKIPAHIFEPQHTHHARVVICLSGAELEHILPDGEKQSSTLKTGEIAWRPAATHIGHNLGQTDLWVVAVEPK